MFIAWLIPSFALWLVSFGLATSSTIAGAAFSGHNLPPPVVSHPWSETQLFAFNGPKDGFTPRAGLLGSASGALSGTTSAGRGFNTNRGTAFELVPGPSGYTERLLHQFRDYPGDGSYPVAPLIADGDGNLYGTTLFGGKARVCGCGTVFELARSGHKYVEKLLHSFRGQTDGSEPQGALVFDAAGVLYGTASKGGFQDNGVVFQLKEEKGDYVEHVIYRFRGGNDGALPVSDLIVGADGSLYGTTQVGGGGSACVAGCGVAFKLSPRKGKYVESVLYRFRGGRDGAVPFAGLISDATGSLFGTTFYGGSSTCIEGQPCGLGTVFKLTPSASGYVESVLYRFKSGVDAQQPASDLLLGQDGSLYGTTYYGGGSATCGGGCGAVFSLVPSPRGYEESVLSNFQYGPDGAVPYGALIWDPQGSLYGVTAYGGSSYCLRSGCGTVYQLSPAGPNIARSLFEPVF